MMIEIEVKFNREHGFDVVTSLTPYALDFCELRLGEPINNVKVTNRWRVAWEMTARFVLLAKAHGWKVGTDDGVLL